MTSIPDIIEKLEKARGPDNALDIEIDIALFKPDDWHVSVRANAAGTKLVYTRHDGGTDTYRAWDHTLGAAARNLAVERLRALSSQKPGNANG
jgi:hypothetical protein